MPHGEYKIGGMNLKIDSNISEMSLWPSSLAIIDTS